MSSRSSHRWELLDSALRGHVHVGVDAATVTLEDGLIVREQGGLRWHRCLRCDGWHPRAIPTQPTRPSVPTRDEIVLPAADQCFATDSSSG